MKDKKTLGDEEEKMKKELKKIGLAVVVASLLSAAIAPMVMAQPTPGPTQEISCTVTAGVYSVSLNRSSVNYGSMAENTNKTDPQGAINATNDAVFIEDLLIRGDDAFGPGLWTLADALGVDTYRHTFTTTGEFNLTKVNQMLANDIPVGGSQLFTLKIYVPTTINDPGTYSTTVTVVATSPA